MCIVVLKCTSLQCLGPHSYNNDLSHFLSVLLQPFVMHFAAPFFKQTFALFKLSMCLVALLLLLYCCRDAVCHGQSLALTASVCKH